MRILARNPRCAFRLFFEGEPAAGLALSVTLPGSGRPSQFRSPAAAGPLSHGEAVTALPKGEPTHLRGQRELTVGKTSGRWC